LGSLFSGNRERCIPALAERDWRSTVMVNPL
jgi:hypothetical protein